jgi:hypothetical protein
VENYSNYYFKKEKKVPSIMVLLAVVGLVFAVNFFSNKPNVTNTQASPTKINKFEFVNETNNSFTVFWRTENETTGWIIYGEQADKTDKIAFDKRDFEDNPKKYRNHFVNIKTLNDSTKYFFYVVIDDKIIKNSLIPLSFSTKDKIASKSNSQPAIGKVVGKNSLPLDQGVVFLRVEGIGTQATLTESTGEWIVPTYYLTKINTSEQFFPSEETPVKIEIIDELGNSSIIDTEFGNISPVPQTIRLGENLSFKNIDQVAIKEAIKDATLESKIKKTDISTSSSVLAKPILEISFPKDNATIDSGKPLFKGIAPTGKKLLASISSKSTQKEVDQKYYFYSDDKGKWSYSPLTGLKSGSYVFTISFVDEKNKEILSTKTFTIIKSGESVLGTATPEATTIIVSSSPTPMITIKPPTPTSPVTVSGDNITPITIGSIALTVIGLGLVLIF